MFVFPVQSSHRVVVIRVILIVDWSNSNTSYVSRASTLWASSEWSIVSTKWLAIALIIETTDLNYRWALFHLLNAAAFFSWLMVGIKGPFTFNTIYINSLFRPSILLSVDILLRVVIDWSTLASNSHYLLLITCPFQIWHIVFLSTSASFSLSSVHSFNLWHSITRI